MPVAYNIREERDCMSGSKTRYIVALDGLRAFAVLAVIAYHFGFGWATGGLLGVTVFFVLSGYLITSLLVGEWRRTKTIDLKSFWIRRARRLLPAIIFVIVCVVILCTIFNHELLTKMRPDIPPALFFFSNWWYIFHDISYFDALGAPSPLTHFWSLAIEEQFYLIWPTLLFFLFKGSSKKKTVSRITLVLTVVSVLLMFFLYDPAADPSRVYYGTDTRAFSLLIGALLAFMWPSNQLSGAGNIELPRATRLVYDGVGIVAFIGLVIMVVTVNGFSPFMYRGGILLASLLTAVVIAVLVHPQSFFARIASLPPLVWIGKRSYGMYLWHYPIMLLMNGGSPSGESNIFFILLQLVVIFICSALSFRFIEDPLRKGAIGKLLSGVRDGSVKLSSYLQSHLIPATLSVALIATAIGGIVFVPSTYAIDETAREAMMKEESVRPAMAVEEETSVTYDPLWLADSVSIRTHPYFEKTFPDGGIDAKVNRQLWEALDIYNYYAELELVGNVVVLAMGTNGAAVDEHIDTIMNTIGDTKQVYLVNIRCPDPWEQQTNETFARAAERYDNINVIDWYGTSEGHEEYFDGDGTHLTEEGAAVYVEMVRVAIGYPIPPDPAQEEQPLPEYVQNAPGKLQDTAKVGARELIKNVFMPPVSDASENQPRDEAAGENSEN